MRLTPGVSVRPARAQFDDVVSPCSGVCSLVGDICRGCHRHIEEIKEWPRLCREAKLEVLRNRALRAT